jgi:hypothetical protein
MPTVVARPSAAGTKLNRDGPSGQSRAGPPTAISRARSILTTPHDERMAKSQLHRDELTGRDAEEQDNWARKMIALIPNACPDNNAFVRSDTHPLYMCEGNGHAVTDELLADGRGGLMASPVKDGSYPFEDFEGPFYLDPTTGLYLTDCEKYKERKGY